MVYDSEFRQKNTEQLKKLRLYEIYIASGFMFMVLVFLTPLVVVMLEMLGVIASSDIVMRGYEEGWYWLLLVPGALVAGLGLGIDRVRSGIKRDLIELYARSHGGGLVQDFEIKGLPFVLGRSGIETELMVAAQFQLEDWPMRIFNCSLPGNSRYEVSYMTVFEATLPQSVPHIYIDSFRVQGFSGSFDYPSTEQLQLEGDFSDKFRVVSHKNAHIDVLSILTPDVMAMLIDNSTEFDIEFVKDKIYILSRDSILSVEDFLYYIELAKKILHTVYPRLAKYSSTSDDLGLMKTRYEQGYFQKRKTKRNKVSN